MYRILFIFSGFVVLVLGELFGIASSAVVLEKEPTRKWQMTPASAEPASPRIKVACVGDSITWSPGAENPTSYPSHLAKLLGPEYEVRNFGVMAQTALSQSDGVYIKTGSYSASKEYLPDIVVIMFGANDSKPQNWAHKDEFQTDVEQLIKSYQTLSNHPQVYLNLPPPAFKNGYGINGSVIENEEIPLLKQAAAATTAKTINVFGAMKDHPELFDDGVHPGSGGRLMLAKVAYSGIRSGVPLPPTEQTAEGEAQEIHVHWSASTGAETYEVERSTREADGYVRIAKDIRDTSYTDKTANVGVVYYYRVRAVSLSGKSGGGDTVSWALAPGEDFSFLSNLKWTAASQGFGQTQNNKDVAGNPIQKDYVVYGTGVGTHAVSTITYALDGKYSRFQSNLAPGNSVTFQVLVDGNSVFQSPVLRADHANKAGFVDVDVRGAQELKLVVGDGGDGIQGDMSAWAGARLKISDKK